MESIVKDTGFSGRHWLTEFTTVDQWRALAIAWARATAREADPSARFIGESLVKVMRSEIGGPPNEAQQTWGPLIRELKERKIIKQTRNFRRSPTRRRPVPVYQWWSE